MRGFLQLLQLPQPPAPTHSAGSAMVRDKAKREKKVGVCNKQITYFVFPCKGLCNIRLDFDSAVLQVDSTAGSEGLSFTCFRFLVFN